MIGEPGKIPQKYRLSSYNVKKSDQMSRQTLIDASTTVEDYGSVVYAFTKLLEEPGEVSVTKGKLIWARGSGGLSYHGSRAGVLELDLETCSAKKIRVESVSSKLIKVHGGLFLMAFSVCMPAALVAARARACRRGVLRGKFSFWRLTVAVRVRYGVLPNDARSDFKATSTPLMQHRWLGPVWIKLHMYLLLLCILIAIAGLVVICLALEHVDKEHFRGRHQRIGLACLAFLAANIAVGLARPEKEGKWRPQFNVVHAFLGVGIFVLAVFATRSGATKAEHLQYVSSDEPWHVAQAALLGGFGALWLGAWARARMSEKEEDSSVRAGRDSPVKPDMYGGED